MVSQWRDWKGLNRASIVNIGNRNVRMLSMHDIAIEEAGNYTCIAHTSNTTPLQKSFILHLQGT